MARFSGLTRGLSSDAPLKFSAAQLPSSLITRIAPSGDATGAADTAAIQAKIDALTAATGGTVLLASGTFTVTGLTVKTGVSLIGNGRDSTILRLHAAANGTVIGSGLGSSNILVSDLTVDGNAASQASGDGGVTFYGATRFTIARVRSVNAFEYGFAFKDSNNAGTGLPCQDGLVIDCTATGSLWQGFAFTCARRMTLVRASADTAGIDGFDFEPNSATDVVEEIGLYDCSVTSAAQVGFNFIDNFGTSGRDIALFSPQVFSAQYGMRVSMPIKVFGGYIGPMTVAGINLDGINQGDNGALFNGLTIKGVNGGATGHGITCSNTATYHDDIQIVNCTIDSVSGRGIVAAPARRWVIAHNIVKRSGNTFGILLTAGTPGDPQNCLVAFNQCYDDQGSPTQTTDIQDAGTSGNNFLLGNYTQHNLAPGSDSNVDNLGNASFGQIIGFGHLIMQSGALAAAAGAQAGTSPPAPVVTSGDSDNGGNITFGTGTTPAAGAMVGVTFHGAYSSAPKGVVVTARNSATQALGLYVSAKSTTAFTVSAASAPAASQGNTIYSFDYVVMG